MADTKPKSDPHIIPFPIQILRGRPPVNDTPEDVTAKAIDFFQHCHDTGEPPTITGLALFLGYSGRQGLIDAAAARDGYLADAINTARSLVEWSYEKQLRTKACLGAIFALKNMGWKDKQEIETRDGDLAQKLKEADEQYQRLRN